MRFSTARRGRKYLARAVNPMAELLESRRLLSVSVLTWHDNLARTGLNDNETQLTPANVNRNSFGKLLSYPIDGQQYAEPLYVANLAIPGKGTHDVVLVVTEHNDVYALDADSNAGPDGGVFWHVNLGPPATTPSPYIGGRYGPWTLVTPYIGIEGTPVIDPSTNTMYLDSFTNPSTGVYQHTIYAIDITTGQNRVPPMPVQATVPGNGAGSTDGQNVPFIANRQQQRPALTLLNGIVYVAYGSFDDTDPHHGWILGYDAATLQLKQIWNSTPNLLTPPGPNAGEGPIWQSGAGLSTDGSNLYAMTGNGDFDTNLNAQGFPTAAAYADSFVKVSTANNTLTLTDYFTPYNQQALTNADNDIGSAGPMVLPDSVGSAAHPHLVVGVGKQGIIWLLDRDNMGKFTPTAPDHVLQEVQLGSGAWSNPAYFNGRIYFHGVNGRLKAYTISNGVLSSSAVAQGVTTYAYPGATPSISSNGTSDGIIWDIQSGGVLHAYDASTLAELYNSNQTAGDQLGSYVKFTTPTIADGKVFVGTANSLAIFGLRPQDTIFDTGGNDTVTLSQDADHQHIDWTMGGSSGKVAIDHPAGLTINGNGGVMTVNLDASNGDPLPNLLTLNGTFTVNGLNAATMGPGQTIDLGASSVTIPYTQASPLAAVQALLNSGYDNGAWDGSGIVSSAARANPQYGIADADSGASILLNYALVGDANQDGKVSFPDFLTLARNYRKTGADWSMGDFDYDGTVDFNDVVLLARNFGQQRPGWPNLIVNGDFSQGNTGFVSGYTNSTDLGPEGTFTVGTNPANYHAAGVASFGDHTTGTGLMLIANGAVTPNVTVWQETVSVQPGTSYHFTGWAREWGGTSTDPSPAVLHVEINAQAAGADYHVPATVLQWSQFSFTWNSGAATTATIRIVDLNTVANGNDFVLDDLSFAPAAPAAGPASASDPAATYGGQLNLAGEPTDARPLKRRHARA